jgi:hypothetical protein
MIETILYSVEEETRLHEPIDIICGDSYARLRKAQITEGSKNKFHGIIRLQDAIAREVIHAESNGFGSKFDIFADDLVLPPGRGKSIVWQLIPPRILIGWRIFLENVGLHNGRNPGAEPLA